MKNISPQLMFMKLREMSVSYEDIVTVFSWIKAHEAIWALIKCEMLRRCERGDRRVGGMGFIDEVRREAKARGDADFLINNNLSPLLCRCFVCIYPEYADRFEFRGLKKAA